MTPPTGLTFVIHILVVIVRKTLAYFGFEKRVPISQATNEPLVPVIVTNRRTQAFYSVVVILVVGIYMSSLVVLFIGRAVHDKHANWKVAGRTVAVVKQAILNIDIPAPPAPGSNLASSDSKVSNELYIPYRFFSDRASPYISLYTQDLRISSTKQK